MMSKSNGTQSAESHDGQYHAENTYSPLAIGQGEDDSEHSSIPLSVFVESECSSTAASRSRAVDTPILEKSWMELYSTTRILIDKAQSLLRLALPSFVLPEARSQHVVNRSKLRPTAYMDGLRGVASFIVLISHFYIDAWCHGVERGFRATSQDTCITQLPIIRILHSGWFAVSVFFILSGFVLSTKPIQLARAQDTAALLDDLASAVFRRALRLFLPIIFITFCTSVCVYNNWEYLGIPGPDTKKITPLPSFAAQMQEWGYIILRIMRPYESEVWFPLYNLHLWTINVEFRGSVLTFLMVLCLSRTKTWIRLGGMMGFIYYTVSIGKWDMSLFLCGIVLAELAWIRRDLARQSTSISVQLIDQWERRAPNMFLQIPDEYRPNEQTRGMVVGLFWTFIFVVSLYLGSWPVKDAHITPGYIQLSKMVPAVYNTEDMRVRYWDFWAAILLLLALENYPVLQRPFTTTMAQYWGKISFALYIIHIPLAFTVTGPLHLACRLRLGELWGHLVGLSVSTALFFWVADLFWRFIDMNSIYFARWLYSKCTRK